MYTQYAFSMSSLPLCYSFAKLLQPTKSYITLPTIIRRVEGEVLPMQHSRNSSSEWGNAVIILHLKQSFLYLIMTVFISLIPAECFVGHPQTYCCLAHSQWLCQIQGVSCFLLKCLRLFRFIQFYSDCFSEPIFSECVPQG